MTKEMLRDKSLDYFEALLESKALERMMWGVIAFAILYFPTIYLARHF